MLNIFSEIFVHTKKRKEKSWRIFLLSISKFSKYIVITNRSSGRNIWQKQSQHIAFSFDCRTRNEIAAVQNRRSTLEQNPHLLNAESKLFRL